MVNLFTCLIVGILVSALFSYVLTFNQATLEMGKELSDTGSKRGFQDAITPPWYTNFAIVIYLLTVSFVIFVFVKQGWIAGLLCIPLIFIGAAAFRVFLLPKPDSKHFKQLIIQSMMNRYADFKKQNDDMRATAIGSLLEKAGYPLPQELEQS